LQAIFQGFMREVQQAASIQSLFKVWIKKLKMKEEYLTPKAAQRNTKGRVSLLLSHLRAPFRLALRALW
jgi:hypothetical protein